MILERENVKAKIKGDAGGGIGMEIKLSDSQIIELQEFLDEAELDYTSGAKGVIQAQVYDGFMSVFYIKNDCAMEMREIMKKYHPERFHK